MSDNKDDEDILTGKSSKKKLLFIIPLILFLGVVFVALPKCGSGDSYTGFQYLNSDKEWRYKTVSNNNIHNFLNVSNIREDTETLKFDVECHMHMATGSTRRCTIYYELNKKLATGTNVCIVTGWIDNGMILKESSIALEEWSENNLVFTTASRPDQVDPKLKWVKENYNSTFVVTSNP